MASKTGIQSSDLKRRLLEKPRRFSFFQAVQLLESFDESPVKLGESGPPSKETIRLRPSVGVSFPSSDIEEIKEYEDEESQQRKYQITTTFMGLYGVASPLPTYYCEEILEDETENLNDDERSPTRDFLDIFHHRILSLLYRCWLKYRYLFQFYPGGRDETSRRFLCLIGIDPNAPNKNLPVPPIALLRFAGLISQLPHSGVSLETMLSAFFSGIPVEVIQCFPRWIVIPDDQRTRLGQQGCGLGEDAVMGSRMFDQMGSFRVRLGPLSKEEFTSFFPVEKRYAQLVFLAKFFVEMALEFDIELVLRAEDVTPAELGGEEPVYLGWNSWVLSGQPEENMSIVLAGSSARL